MSGLVTLIPMPPSSTPDPLAEEERSSSTTDKWLDLDPPLRNSDRLVAVFSQSRYDGRITFSVHREFDRRDHGTGEVITLKTSFVPESLFASYTALLELVGTHIEKLRVDRAEGRLPFPEGGVEAPVHEERRRRRR